MKNKLTIMGIFIFMTIPFILVTYSSIDAAIIIDHLCTDLSEIPLSWIDSVQANCRLHYAHTSHGGQLTIGLERIENTDSTYKIARGISYLPTVPGSFCIFDGQEGDSYITPDEYWETVAGMNLTRDVLNNNSTINSSMWSWCCQMDGYSESQIQAYLDSITTLEGEYPDVTFIYMTGNAQAEGSGGNNRYLRNEQVRQYCITNDKVLFDFADLDSWWYNPASEEWEYSTYDYGGDSIPVEHPQFNGDQGGHTTFESCEQKGKAVWWMMAQLAGWSGTFVTEGGNTKSLIFSLNQNYPNPFTTSTTIILTLPSEGHRAEGVELNIYDITGRLVRIIVPEFQSSRVQRVEWDGKSDSGEILPGGIYFYILETNDKRLMRKAILLR